MDDRTMLEQWREFCREDAEEVGDGAAVQGDMLLPANWKKRGNRNANFRNRG